MKSNYKRLGDYIERCDELNVGMEVKELLGISNKKYFQKAKTNTIGINLAKYRIVRQNQFAFNRATTRNGDKISIALRQDSDCIVSPSYRIFKVKDEEVLNSEYLMMWFRRPEFDRYARFKSHGSAHEFFSFKNMCEVELPVPSIEKQRAIVKEYNTLVNRIQLNEQLNQQLEETAQAIYKHWFVDFEFPNKQGLPYQSSGGAMVYNEELDIDVPKGWEVKTLEYLTNRVCVGFVGSCYDSYCKKADGIPMLRTTDLTESGMSYNSLKYVTKTFHNKNKKSQLRKGDILVARHGTNGLPAIFDANFEANCLNTIIIKPNQDILPSKLLQTYLKSNNVKEQIQSSLGGSVQAVLNTKIIANLFFAGNFSLNKKISINLNKIQHQIEVVRKENRLLEKLELLTLSKITQKFKEDIEL